MPRYILGLIYCAVFLGAVAVLARLPLASPLVEGLALLLVMGVLVVTEWPRWAPGHDHHWPNKLGRL